MEETDFCFINATKQAVFNAPSFFQFHKLLIQQQFDLLNAFNNLMKPSILAFMKKKPA